MVNHNPLSEIRFKKGNIPWNKGGVGLQIPWNKNKTMNELILGYKNPSENPIVADKISKAMRGKKKSDEHKKKLSGENHYNWKGGIRSNPIAYQEKKAGRKKPDNCELCGLTGRICFDHDHETGQFRGWICSKCNAVLGLAGDSANLLMKMVIYIKNSKNQ